MKKINPTTSLLIVIIGVAIIGLVIFYAQSKSHQLTTAQLATTTNQIAGWNTYTNFGIQFQHPKSSVGSITRETITPDTTYISVPGVEVQIYDISVGGNNKASQQISIGGKTATEVTDGNGLTGGRTDVFVNFTDNAKIISFGGVQIDPALGPTVAQQLKKDLYDIAATYNPYKNSQTSKAINGGWRLYKNYGIEFEYPEIVNGSNGISSLQVVTAAQNDPNSGIGSNGCEVMPNNPALRTSRVTINNMGFCLGSAMTPNDIPNYPSYPYFYHYTFLKDGKYYTVSYSLSSPNPTNSNSIIKQVEKSISTLKFIN